MKEWITPIATILGVLAGGAIGLLNTRMQMRNQADRERKKVMLEKLESLHETISGYLLAFTSTSANILQLEVSGKAPTEPFAPFPQQRFIMLIGFYAPELEEKRLEIEQLGRRIVEVMLPALFDVWGDHIARKKGLLDFMAAMAPFQQRCEEMQRQVVELSKKYI